MGVVRVKPGVVFVSHSPPASFRIFAALVDVAEKYGHDLTITSAADGEHSGPDDPHHRGEAFDIRTRDLPEPQQVLALIQAFLGPQFYAFIEDPMSLNEHLHCQVAKGHSYP